MMEIVNFKKIEKGCLVARFDVYIPQWGFTIRGCSLFDKGGNRWIGMPSHKVELDDGTTKHFEHVAFDKSIRDRFHSACMEKIDSGLYTKAKENTESLFNPS